MAKKPETTVVPEETTTLPLEAVVPVIEPETPAAEEATVAAEPETPAAEEATVAAEPETPVADPDETADPDADPDPEEPEPIEPTAAEIEAAKKAEVQRVRRMFLALLETPMSQTARAQMLTDLAENNAAQVKDGVLSLAGIEVALNADDLAKTFADWCYSARIRVMAEA